MRISIILTVITLFISCNPPGEKGRKVDPPSDLLSSDSLIELNKSLIGNDISIIEDYIKSKGMQLNKSGTGLFYKLLTDSAGPNAAAGDPVAFSYRIKSLGGQLIYSSGENGIRKFIVDQSNIESGWNEAAKMMSPGDSALLIMPPHLAFGHLGDGNRIGSREILIYELRMECVK